ncbi:MAG: BMC domain-containing protein [Eubacteriales bacterium]
MGKSFGFVEIVGVVAAVDALDIMCKTSGVELETWERKLGGRLATIVISGDISAVTEAIEAAKAHAIKAPVQTGVIANPHEEIVRLVNLSASRFKNKAK